MQNTETDSDNHSIILHTTHTEQLDTDVVCCQGD